MTTKARPKAIGKYLWRVRRMPDGEIRFFPVGGKEEAKETGGTVTATLPSKIVAGGRTGEVEDAVAAACGERPSVRGRRLVVDVDADAVGAVGDALESFGCQWDMEG